MFTDFDIRMKSFETKTFIDTTLPVIIRIDGRAFHTFTKHLKKPYCPELSELFKLCTKELIKETNALIGYTQSDEISLLLYNSNPKGEIYFNGCKEKIISITASLCSAYFNTNNTINPGKIATFDARVFNTPSKTEAVNYFIWRQQDCIRNSILSAGYSEFPHKQLLNKNTKQVLEKLKEKGIIWGEYPNFFKYGSFFTKINVEYNETTISDNYKYAVNFFRSEIVNLNWQKLTDITNREQKIFKEDL